MTLSGNDMERFYTEHLDEDIRARAAAMARQNVNSNAWKYEGGVTPFFYAATPRQGQNAQENLELDGECVVPSATDLERVLNHVFTKRYQLKGALKVVERACKEVGIYFPKETPHSALIAHLTQRAFNAGGMRGTRQLSHRSWDLISNVAGGATTVPKGTSFEHRRHGFTHPLSIRAKQDIPLASFLTMAMNLGALDHDEQIDLITNPESKIDEKWNVYIDCAKIITTRIS